MAESLITGSSARPASTAPAGTALPAAPHRDAPAPCQPPPCQHRRSASRGSGPGMAPVLPVRTAAGLPAPPEPGAARRRRDLPGRHRRRAAAGRPEREQRRAERGLHRPAGRQRRVPQLHRADAAADTGPAAGGRRGRRRLGGRGCGIRHLALRPRGPGRPGPAADREIRRDHRLRPRRHVHRDGHGAGDRRRAVPRRAGDAAVRHHRAARRRACCGCCSSCSTWPRRWLPSG